MDAMGAAGSEQRIGATERDEVDSALRTHLDAGRLTPEEYEDRSVAVRRARTWGEVAPLFGDLPDPRPAPVVADLARVTPARAGGLPAIPDGVRDRIMAVTPLVALILFFTTGTWLWFLAIPIAAALLYGSEHKHRR